MIDGKQALTAMCLPCSVTEHGVFSEPQAAYLVKQVLSGVAYLHSKGIVHRDLKLENLLLHGELPKAVVKIADFGLSKVFSSNATLSTVCGSPLYMAPELLMLDQKSAYSPAVDIWSVGVILFILLAGYSPFGTLLVVVIVNLSQILVGCCINSFSYMMQMM